MIYCDVVKNERVEKCQRALANLTIKMQFVKRKDWKPKSRIRDKPCKI